MPLYSGVLQNFVEFKILSRMKHIRQPLLGVVPKSVIQKMLTNNNFCTYQTIQKRLNTGSMAIHKIIHQRTAYGKFVVGSPLI